MLLVNKSLTFINKYYLYFFILFNKINFRGYAIIYLISFTKDFEFYRTETLLISFILLTNSHMNIYNVRFKLKVTNISSVIIIKLRYFTMHFCNLSVFGHFYHTIIKSYRL